MPVVEDWQKKTWAGGSLLILCVPWRKEKWKKKREVEGEEGSGGTSKKRGQWHGRPEGEAPLMSVCGTSSILKFWGEEKTCGRQTYSGGGLGILKRNSYLSVVWWRMEGREEDHRKLEKKRSTWQKALCRDHRDRKRKEPPRQQARPADSCMKNMWTLNRHVELEKKRQAIHYWAEKQVK